MFAQTAGLLAVLSGEFAIARIRLTRGHHVFLETDLETVSVTVVKDTNHVMNAAG
jgi:hypothetical protein